MSENICINGKEKKLTVNIKQHKKHRPNDKKSNWLEMDQLYNSIKDGLVTIIESVRTLLEDTDIRLALSQNKEITVLIIGFYKDVNAFTNELMHIYNKHKHKVGLVKNKDIDLQLHVAGEYIELGYRMQSILLPTFAGISTEIGNLICVADNNNTVEIKQLPQLNPIEENATNAELKSEEITNV
jgi:hypothetical protein